MTYNGQPLYSFLGDNTTECHKWPVCEGIRRRVVRRLAGWKRGDQAVERGPQQWLLRDEWLEAPQSNATRRLS